MSAPRVTLSQHPQSAVGPRVSDTAGAASTAGQQGGPGEGPTGGAGAARAAAATAPARQRGGGKFRFWHDERRFKGPADKCIVQQALFDAGGVRTGGHPKCSPIPGPLGYQRGADWDMLWSPARTALKALPAVKPGQLVSALPGMMSITRKRRLGVTLKAAYGPDAFDLVPLTFSLPAELPAWREQLGKESSDCASGPGPWMLKTAQHLGMGLCLLPGEQAFSHALQPRPPSAKPWVLAQRYVSDPLLIDGRKFGVRLWVLVTGVSPLRAYVSDRGLVLFSTEGYDADSLSDDGDREGEGDPDSDGDGEGSEGAAGGGAGRGHVTNYAQNVDGTVWDLGMLEEHLGAEAYGALWSKLVASAARVVAAALPEALSEQAKLKLPASTTFELLGLDYLVDSSHHPWLLEVNGTPSLAVEHSEPAVEALIHEQKAGMVRDMVSLLGCSSRFDIRYSMLRAAAAKDKAAAMQLRNRLAGGGGDGAALELARRELRARGGFMPLMPHFPVSEAYDAGYAIPWGPRDYALRSWMQENEAEWQQQQQEPQQQRQQQQRHRRRAAGARNSPSSHSSSSEAVPPSLRQASPTEAV